jgi:hypothetical protein
MLIQAPLVDGFGNLSLHVLADLVLPVRGGESMPTLAERNMVFAIPARRIRHTLEEHPSEPTWKQINIPAAQLTAVQTNDAFVLLDVTNGRSNPLWEGTITRRGL